MGGLTASQRRLASARSGRICCRRQGRKVGSLVVLGSLLVLAGCSGPLSTLDAAGRGAERIATLFWWLAASAILIWVAVIGLTVYAVRLRPEPHSQRAAKLLIIGGGVALPTLVLAGYLVYGLSLLPDLLQPAPPGSLRIAVTGEQWWWRVRYLAPDGEAVELANELRLPVGEPVEVLLDSPDVIHSFWIPSLAGKLDMIPGRVNRMALEPTKTGVFQGACAEYCGTAHALMRFYVAVEEKEKFARWLARQKQPAQAAAGPLARRGQELFLANGCGACHAIRGTPAEGVIGPDLTHVGGRLSLGAGILPNEADDFLRWMARTEDLKPGVHMPSFGMLPTQHLRALAAYLDGLE
nr:cytochrome c oxidase subunit II [Gammaproteobacteria bacterium]